MNKFDEIFKGVYFCRTMDCNRCPYYIEDEPNEKVALCKKKLLNDTIELLNRVGNVIGYSINETK